MCEHKNLRTVGDRLFCKDCKEELPLEFLTLNEGLKPIQEEQDNASLEAEEILEDKLAEEVEPEEVSEPAQEEQKPDIQPAEKEESAIPAPKKERAKTTRKTAKKGE